tara:strand:- start:2555 stop:3004 length:450 start_codon:yes stop_codon:yes gene_type:complete
MFTPESLLALAAESEASYLELLAQHPPGTIHDGRNEARRSMEHATACALWMERNGHKELAYVGPFGSMPFSRDARVRVRKGAVVHGIKVPNGGAPAKTSRVVTVHSVDKGYVWHDGPEGRDAVHQPKVHWAGAGGYWRWVDANDVEPVA